jgi:hypothetical protein
VPVGPDGTATVTWTPTQPYTHFLTVRSVTAAGTASGPAYFSMWVNP